MDAVKKKLRKSFNNRRYCERQKEKRSINQTDSDQMSESSADESSQIESSTDESNESDDESESVSESNGSEYEADGRLSKKRSAAVEVSNKSTHRRTKRVPESNRSQRDAEMLEEEQNAFKAALSAADGNVNTALRIALRIIGAQYLCGGCKKCTYDNPCKCDTFRDDMYFARMRLTELSKGKIPRNRRQGTKMMELARAHAVSVVLGLTGAATQQQLEFAADVSYKMRHTVRKTQSSYENAAKYQLKNIQQLYNRLSEFHRSLNQNITGSAEASAAAAVLPGVISHGQRSTNMVSTPLTSNGEKKRSAISSDNHNNGDSSSASSHEENVFHRTNKQSYPANCISARLRSNDTDHKKNADRQKSATDDGRLVNTVSAHVCVYTKSPEELIQEATMIAANQNQQLAASIAERLKEQTSQSTCSGCQLSSNTDPCHHCGAFRSRRVYIAHAREILRQMHSADPVTLNNETARFHSNQQEHTQSCNNQVGLISLPSTLMTIDPIDHANDTNSPQAFMQQEQDITSTLMNDGDGGMIDTAASSSTAALSETCGIDSQGNAGAMSSALAASNNAAISTSYASSTHRSKGKRRHAQTVTSNSPADYYSDQLIADPKKQLHSITGINTAFHFNNKKARPNGDAPAVTAVGITSMMQHDGVDATHLGTVPFLAAVPPTAESMSEQGNTRPVNQSLSTIANASAPLMNLAEAINASDDFHRPSISPAIDGQSSATIGTNGAFPPSNSQVVLNFTSKDLSAAAYYAADQEQKQMKEMQDELNQSQKIIQQLTSEKNEVQTEKHQLELKLLSAEQEASNAANLVLQENIQLKLQLDALTSGKSYAEEQFASTEHKMKQMEETHVSEMKSMHKQLMVERSSNESMKLKHEQEIKERNESLQQSKNRISELMKQKDRLSSDLKRTQAEKDAASERYQRALSKVQQSQRTGGQAATSNTSSVNELSMPSHLSHMHPSAIRSVVAEGTSAFQTAAGGVIPIASPLSIYQQNIIRQRNIDDMNRQCNQQVTNIQQKLIRTQEQLGEERKRREEAEGKLKQITRISEIYPEKNTHGTDCTIASLII
jgi:hypothetical protein